MRQKHIFVKSIKSFEMDLAERKNKFIEQFMKLTSPEKIKRLEKVLKSEMENPDGIVAYTVTGEPLTKEQYQKRVKEADAAIDRGEYTSVVDLEQEAKDW